jgi:phenylpropionate dioxygenase-like ring-hydroxylating dioxygenase large terminal subunit
MNQPKLNVSAEDPSCMPKVREYLDTDRGTPPKFLYEDSTHDLGNAAIPVERYVSPKWHQREVEKLWLQTWQMACRENDLPNVGDQLAYDIVGQSAIVVRSSENEIKAFYNSCRHRGNRLLEGAARSKTISCSMHSWTWNLDGTINRIPCRWDFPNVSDERAALVPLRAECWNGMVFVNFDANAAPLADFLTPQIRSQWERWPQGRCWKSGHVAKVVPCNWKAAIEAFLESYHVFRVHPQITPHTGDCNSKYDFYGPHGRMIVPIGVASPHMGGLEEQAVVEAMMGDLFSNFFGADAHKHTIPKIGPGETSRTVLSDYLRGMHQARGLDLSKASDSEILDAVEYFVYPNLILWGGYSLPLYYRVRPNGQDHNSCIWELMVVVPMPEGVPLPPDAPLRMTPSDEPWAAAAELGGLGPLVDQDMVNLAKLQRGLQSRACSELVFSNYQERNLRNFHQHLEKQLS